MKLLFDFFPILLFFIAYKLYGIYIATGVAIGASGLQVAGYYAKHRQVEKLHLLTLALVVVLGGATLFLHDETFIKWKPTVINWLFSALFIGSQFIGREPLIKRMMRNNINLPTAIWSRLNMSWAAFFAVMGCANLIVMYNFDTNTWVNFKLFGILGFTLLFVIIQAVYLAKYVETDKRK